MEKSGWGKPVADGHALGFSYAKVVETYVAAVGEVSLDAKTGIVRAHHFGIALDPGVVLNPGQRLGADRRQRHLRLEPDLEGAGDVDRRRPGRAE